MTNLTIRDGRVYATLTIKSKRNPTKPYRDLFSSNGSDCVFEYPRLLAAMDFDDKDATAKTKAFRKEAARLLK